MARARITEALRRVLSRSPLRVRATYAMTVLVLSLATVTSKTAGDGRGGRGHRPHRACSWRAARRTGPSGAYPSRQVSPQPHRASEIGNVVVYLKDAPRATTPAGRAQCARTKGSCTTVAVTRGSTSVPERGSVSSQRLRCREAAFDSALPGAGRSRTFGQPGLVKVYCHLLADEREHHGVRPPAFRDSRTDGHFALADVPAGVLPQRLARADRRARSHRRRSRAGRADRVRAAGGID